jgi:phosphatidylglycerophosphate synthase
MKIKQKVIMLTLALGTFLAAAVGPTAMAQTECGGVKTAIIQCSQSGDAGTAQDSAVWAILLIVLNILTAGVGILAVAGIVYAAILYSSASDEASQVQNAKTIIKNVVIGLILYGSMYLLLNYLIPGGIFQ